MAEEKIIYKLEFQSGDLDKQLGEINRQMTHLNNTQKDLRKNNKQSSKEFKDNKQQLKQLGAEYRVVSQAMSNTNKLRQKNVGYLESQKAKLSLVTAQINKLSKAELDNVTIGGRLIKTQKQISDELKKFEEKGGAFYRSVGNYAKGLKSLWTHFSYFFGITAIIRLFTNFFNTIKTFEQQSARLASVLGTTKDEISDLTTLARELGATTQYTATQVLTLAESLAKLGFENEDIKAMTGDVLNLATALDAELDQAATLAGSTIRAFGLTAQDSGHVMDVLAKSTTITSLSFSKLETALPIVGTVAKNAGVGLETLVAQLGALTDRGIDASTAGTSLRKIYLELAKSGMSIEEAFNRINNATDKNKESLNLFGIRASTAGVILAGATEKVNEFDEALTNADGTTKAMADERLDTLAGSVLLVKSAWDEYLLSLNETSGIGEKLKGIFQFLAENMKEIMRVVGLLIAGFVTYKTTIAAITIGTAAYNSVVNIAKASTISFNAVLKSTPWGAIVAGITMLIYWLATMKKEVKETRDYTKSFNEELAKETTLLNNNFSILKKTKEGTIERKKAIEDINKQYGQYLPNLLTEKSSLDEITVAQKLATKAIYENIFAKAKQEEITKAITDAVATQTEILRGEGSAMSQEQIAVFKVMSDQLSQFKKGSTEYNKALEDMRSNTFVFQSVGLGAFTKYTESLRSMNQELTNIERSFGDLNNTVGAGNGNGNDDDPDDPDDITRKASERAYKQAQIDLEKYRLLFRDELKKQTELSKAQAEELIGIKQEELQKELTVLEEKNKLEKDKLKIQQEEKKITEEEYLEKLYILNENYLISKDKLVFKYEDETIKINENSVEYIRTLNVKKLDFEKQYYKNKLKAGEISQVNFNKKMIELEIEYLELSKNYATLSEEEKQIEIQKIRLKYATETAKKEKDIFSTIFDSADGDSDGLIGGAKRDEHLAELEETYDMAIQLAQDYINYLAEMQAMEDERELEALISKHEKINEENEFQNKQEMLLLEKKFKTGEISEEQYYKQRIKLEANFNKKQNKLKDKQKDEEDALRREALEEQKKYAIAAVILNSAQAILSAWANTIPYPAGAIYAGIQTGIIAAATAIQVSQINSQSLATGGLLDGPSHMSGGIQIGMNEVEGGEYIINKASTQQYKPILDYINDSGNGIGNSGNVKEIIDYRLMAKEIGKVINDKKVILTQDDLVDDEDTRINIEENTTF